MQVGSCWLHVPIMLFNNRCQQKQASTAELPMMPDTTAWRLLLTPLPAHGPCSTAGQDGCSKAPQVVGDVPHSPVGPPLLGGKPGRQDPGAAGPAKALQVGQVT